MQTMVDKQCHNDFLNVFTVWKQKMIKLFQYIRAESNGSSSTKYLFLSHYTVSGSVGCLLCVSGLTVHTHLRIAGTF